jgi:hypothetical protein
MLNPKFKSLILISNFFIGHELGVAIATKFENKSLYSILLLKSYHHLHPLAKIESSFVNKSNEDNNLDIFEMVTSTNELTKEPVNQKLMIFCRFQMDALWSGGKNMNLCSQLLVFFSIQILGIISSQIKLKFFFFLFIY